MKKIQLRTRGSTEIISVEDIVRIEADGNYSIIMIDGETKRISKKISYFETELDDFDFVRIHHSHLVNVKRIKSIKIGKNMVLQLDNDTLLPISGSYKDRLVRRLGEEFKKV